jgi:hypothetical protein
VDAHVLAEVELRVLIAWHDLRTHFHWIEFRALVRRTRALAVGTARRADASPVLLDEVHVAARESLLDAAGALADPTTPIRVSGPRHGQRQDTQGDRQTELCRYPTDVLLALRLHGRPPSFRDRRSCKVGSRFLLSSDDLMLMDGCVAVLFIMNVCER